jgi:hypothetical protein
MDLPKSSIRYILAGTREGHRNCPSQRLLSSANVDVDQKSTNQPPNSEDKRWCFHRFLSWFVGGVHSPSTNIILNSPCNFSKSSLPGGWL